MTPEVVVRVPYPESGLDLLRRDFSVSYVPDSAELDRLVAERGSEVRAVVTNGRTGLSGQHMRALPRLEIVLTRGVGFEAVDIETARERKIVVANSHGVNGFAVADHAIALLLGILRDTKGSDEAVRRGDWVKRNRVDRPILFRKRVGILGLGDIGLGIARRVSGFETEIAYHNRAPRNDVQYKYISSIAELADRSDILFISCPGGPSTRGLVDRQVLDALGPSGFLVNVARGSVVDTTALVNALNAGRIGGAALDVLDGEPIVSEAVLNAPNLLITPHVGSRSPESSWAAITRVSEDLNAHFAGASVSSRII